MTKNMPFHQGGILPINLNKFSTVMTSPGPAFQECTGSCHENVPNPKDVTCFIYILDTARPRDMRLLVPEKTPCSLIKYETLLLYKS